MADWLLSRLAEETDSNPERRIAALQARRSGIDRDLATLRGGGVVRTLPAESALVEVRKISHMADELRGDFRLRPRRLRPPEPRPAPEPGGKRRPPRRGA